MAVWLPNRHPESIPSTCTMSNTPTDMLSIQDTWCKYTSGQKNWDAYCHHTLVELRIVFTKISNLSDAAVGFANCINKVGSSFWECDFGSYLVWHSGCLHGMMIRGGFVGEPQQHPLNSSRSNGVPEESWLSCHWRQSVNLVSTLNNTSLRIFHGLVCLCFH